MDAARNALTFMYEIEAESLEQYIATMESALSLAQKDLFVRLDAMTKDLPEQDVENIIQWAEADAFFLHLHGPSVMWQSVFTVVYSFFEQKLEDFAQEVNVARTQTKASDPVLRLSFWSHDHVVAYLKKQIKFPSGTEAWSEIQHYKRIRNLIAHRGGHLTDPSWLASKAFTNELDEEKKKDIKAAVKKSLLISKYIECRAKAKKIGIESRGYIVVLGPEFCREALDTFKIFFDDLSKAI